MEFLFAAASKSFFIRLLNALKFNFAAAELLNIQTAALFMLISVRRVLMKAFRSKRSLI